MLSAAVHTTGVSDTTVNPGNQVCFTASESMLRLGRFVGALTSAPHAAVCGLLAPMLILLLACATGCSPGQKSGGAISVRDIAKAMPEFVLVPPPGSTNLYFRQVSNPQFSIVFLKLSVPRSGVTNFLRTSGLFGLGEFIPIPAGVLPKAGMPSLNRLDASSALAWAAEVRHSSEWDPGKNNTPLLMTATKTSALASPKMEVLATVTVENSTSPQANVYIQYCRVPKRR
jgi:hypothetical protein